MSGAGKYVLFSAKTQEYFMYYDMPKSLVVTTTDAKQAMKVERKNQDAADAYAKYVRGKDQLERFWQAERADKHNTTDVAVQPKQGGLWG